MKNTCPYEIAKSPFDNYKECNKECPVLASKPLCKRWDLCSTAKATLQYAK